MIGMFALLSIPILWVSINFLPPNFLYRSQIKTCEKMISRIESYKAQTGRYPNWNDWETLGIKDESDPRFYRVNSDGYVVGFSFGFDEMYEWDSRTKRWSFEN
jgi:hypothetical protein